MLKIKWWKWTSLSYFWSWKKRFNLFTIEYDVICGFVAYRLYYIEVFSLYSHLIESFYHEQTVNFIKCFLYLLKQSYDFILCFVDAVYHINLQILNHVCIPGRNASWSYWMILLIYCWFSHIWLRMFTSLFARIITCHFFVVSFFFFFFFFLVYYQGSARLIEWI